MATKTIVAEIDADFGPIPLSVSCSSHFPDLKQQHRPGEGLQSNTVGRVFITSLQARTPSVRIIVESIELLPWN